MRKQYLRAAVRLILILIAGGVYSQAAAQNITVVGRISPDKLPKFNVKSLRQNERLKVVNDYLANQNKLTVKELTFGSSLNKGSGRI